MEPERLRFNLTHFNREWTWGFYQQPTGSIFVFWCLWGGGQAQGPDYLEKIDPFVWVNRLIYVGVFIGLDIRGKLFWFLQYLIAIGRGFYVVY